MLWLGWQTGSAMLGYACFLWGLISSVLEPIGLHAESAFLGPQLPKSLVLTSLEWDTVCLGLLKCLYMAALEGLVISYRKGQQF